MNLYKKNSYREMSRYLQQINFYECNFIFEMLFTKNDMRNPLIYGFAFILELLKKVVIKKVLFNLIIKII